MSTFYYYIGLVFFWSIVLAGLVFDALVMWDAHWFFPARRRIKHLLLYCKAVRAPDNHFNWGISLSQVYISIAKRDKWDWWERNMLALIIKKSRPKWVNE